MRFWLEPNHPGSHDGPTQADGSFELSCVPGKYAVTLINIPTKHSDPGAGATVNPGQPAAKTTIPTRFQVAHTTPWRGIEVSVEGRSGLELAIVE